MRETIENNKVTILELELIRLFRSWSACLRGSVDLDEDARKLSPAASPTLRILDCRGTFSRMSSSFGIALCYKKKNVPVAAN